ncbi:MAG: hypothetical protein HYR96_15640 [Deltaproteobacteria bacterium]|nr:hypothetical protein [Deltaproteobacteria bacterium]MBI3293933.1 hypothetical protein [Deltaproteobacteria bacterium]
MRLALSLALLFSVSILAAPTPPPAPTNKLLMMHRLYYLPFTLNFTQGSNTNEIIPTIALTGKVPTNEEFTSLNKTWEGIREEWAKNSLVLNTNVGINQSSRISGHLASHHIALDRGPFDSLSVGEQIQIKNLLQGTPEIVTKTFTQVRFLKSFLNDFDSNRNVLFVVGPSWCQSSRTYRMLVESYLKKLPLTDLTVHSIVIEDPKNQVFESPLMSTLFPNSGNYSHNTVPRFLFLENNPEKPVLFEEGEALSQLLDRYFGRYRGFFDSQVAFLSPRMRGLSGGWTNR